MKFWDNESIERFLTHYNSIYLTISTNKMDSVAHVTEVLICKQVAFTLIVNSTVIMDIKPEFDRYGNVKFDNLILTVKPQ